MDDNEQEICSECGQPKRDRAAYHREYMRGYMRRLRAKKKIGKVGFDRLAYYREYMRKRRAKKLAAKQSESKAE